MDRQNTAPEARKVTACSQAFGVWVPHLFGTQSPKVDRQNTAPEARKVTACSQAFGTSVPNLEHIMLRTLV